MINYFNDITKENKVMFTESIQVEDTIIGQDELNFVLEALLYLKKLGI